MRSSVFVLATCAGLLGAVTSCNKTNNVSTSNETNNVFSKEIDEDGGTVGEKGGLSVYIPGGAVGEPVTITIREADDGEYPALTGSVAGEVYAIEPHGLELSAKATVHLPFPAGYEPGYLQPIHAPLNGAWEPINGGLEHGASTATFGTYSFSFFALQDQGSATGGAGVKPVPEPGDPGGGGSAYGGGASSYGGAMTGTGGTPYGGSGPGGTDYCPADQAAATGSSDIAGNLKLASGPNNFMALDGFASKLIMGEHTRLLLTFTDSALACGAALAGGTPLGSKPIPGARPGVSVSLALLVFTPSTPGEIGEQTTYPRGGQPDMVEIMAYELDADCREMPSQLAPSTTVTIDTLTADRVTGSIMVPDDGTGSSVSGAFDVPFCALPEAPSGRCCVEP